MFRESTMTSSLPPSLPPSYFFPPSFPPSLLPSLPLSPRLLSYKPAGSKLNLEIVEADLDCLYRGEYLNDKIIDFYLM